MPENNHYISQYFCDLSTMDLPDLAYPPNLIRQVMNTKYGLQAKTNRMEFIFSGPATIFFCGEKKVVVKCCEKDTYDFVKGATMAMLKMFTTEGFYKEFKKRYNHGLYSGLYAAEGILLYKLGEDMLTFYNELAIKGWNKSQKKQLV